MKNIELIENYIVYLITKCALSVTLHPLESETLITFSPLMRFNIHDNSYCTAVKSSKEGRARCLDQQRRVLDKCKKCGEFSGHCYAGVFEFVYPIFDGERTIGFISVSGYSTERGRALAEENLNNGKAYPPSLLSIYDALPIAPLDRREIDTLVLPLCRMLELAYIEQRRAPKEDDEALTKRICRYVCLHYTEDITVDTVCRELYCSRSSVSHTFKKMTGQSFRDYLLSVRISHAKRLLKYSELSVTEIAVSVGFNNSGYFSMVFKSRESLSPLAYRRKNR